MVYIKKLKKKINLRENFIKIYKKEPTKNELKQYRQYVIDKEITIVDIFKDKVIYHNT